MRISSIKNWAGAVLALLVILASRDPAFALPSFARQTGMSCTACHTAFPELTTYGRNFKLNGYTLNNSEQVKDGSDDAGYRLQISNVPPISAMLQVADTFVKNPPPGSVNALSDNNGSLEFPSQLSLFYAGAISPKMGAFVQFTYSSGSGSFGMDNTDIRLADHFTVANTNLVLGMTLNNNPTVQDVFNTVPAWGFPYASSQTADALGITPGASPMIANLGGSAGGLGAYAFWNDLLYAELSFYRSIPQGALGMTGSTDIQGYAPYWRVALTHDFDEHSIEVGAYGMDIHVYPDAAAILDPAAPQDDYNDFALDAQYQFTSKVHSLTLKGTCIWENQNLGYSSTLGALTNPTDTLTTLKVDLTYYYDNKIGATIAYFNTAGSRDAALYSPAPVTGYADNVPDTNGMIFEVNYMAWDNTKLSLQYTYYNKFNGAENNYDNDGQPTGRNASDNNTLMAMAWLMY